MRKLAILIAVATATAAFAVATSAAQGTPTRFCNATVKLYSLFNNEPDDESSPEEVEAFGRRVSSQLEKLSTSAPPEVSANVEALIPIITASAGNEQDPFENPEFVTNYEAINEYLATSCGFESVDVTMADYEFVGIPRTLDTGTVAFNLTNEGAEFHELFVFRIKTDDSLREVLELSDRQLMRRVEPLGGGFAPPGESDTSFIKFSKPGRYGAVCNIPVGSTPDVESGDGPPHFVEGMAVPFRVRRA